VDPSFYKRWYQGFLRKAVSTGATTRRIYIQFTYRVPGGIFNVVVDHNDQTSNVSDGRKQHVMYNPSGGWKDFNDPQNRTATNIVVSSSSSTKAAALFGIRQDFERTIGEYLHPRCADTHLEEKAPDLSRQHSPISMDI
jgi:hypothetical protein